MNRYEVTITRDDGVKFRIAACNAENETAAICAVFAGTGYGEHAISRAVAVRVPNLPPPAPLDDGGFDD